jgi:hypothetical protein
MPSNLVELVKKTSIEQLVSITAQMSPAKVNKARASFGLAEEVLDIQVAAVQEIQRRRLCDLLAQYMAWVNSRRVAVRRA